MTTRSMGLAHRRTCRSVRWSSAGAGFFLFVLLGAPDIASAESPAQAKLRYDILAPKAQCPDEGAFRSLITARVGRDLFDDAVGQRRVTITIEPEGRGLIGHARIADTAGTPRTRDVRGSTTECEAIIEALAAVVALALSPESAFRPKENEPASLPALPSASSSPPAPASSPEPPPTTPAPALRSDHHLRLEARAAGVTSIGLLPALSVGGEVGAGINSGAFSLLLFGRGETLPSATRGGLGERLDASILTAGLSPCGRIAVLTGCMVGWLGVLQGRAPDAATPSLGSSTIALVSARIGAEVPLGLGLALAPQLEIGVPLVRTTLLYASNPTWTAPALIGSFGVGLTYVSRP